MAAMQKTFKCLTCQQDIKLERKPDNSGWNKFNLDGTPHIDQKKKQQQQAQKPTATQVQQTSPTPTTTTASNNNSDNITNEINQLKAEIRESFEQISRRLDKIQDLARG